MSKRDVEFLLDDILECCQKIKIYTENYTFDIFINDSKTVDAVVRNFITIGEAASKIDDDYKYKEPQVEWKQLKNFRNKMVNDYTGTDYEIVWETIVNHVDELEFQIQELINNIHSNDKE